EGTWAISACARSHLYRQGRAVQYQCFDVDGVFSWEIRGTLTAEAAVSLDEELATADLANTDPVNSMGFCGASDTQGMITVWIREHNISFAPFCLTAGIESVYQEISAIHIDVSGCEQPFQRLESVEPGCRFF